MNEKKQETQKVELTMDEVRAIYYLADVALKTSGLEALQLVNGLLAKLKKPEVEEVEEIVRN